jgi:biofilm PGA synthesis lipoprotein PgaB
VIDGHDPVRRAVLAAALVGTAGWFLSACTASASSAGASASGSVAGGLKPGTGPATPANTATGLSRQVVLPEPAISSQLRATYSTSNGLPHAFDRSLLVLNYHDVLVDGHRSGIPGEDHYTVFAEDFSRQMQMLYLAGFRSVGIAEVLAARRSGHALPRRSVLITFDDGGSGQWTCADQVLARYGFRAVAFVITSFVGKPTYLAWAEVEAMQQSGRWEVQDHTHADHHLVSRGRNLSSASVLINRKYDAATGSLESLAGARTRVRTDLQTSIDLLSSHGIARPTAFAYPYSQVLSPTNDPQLASYVRRLLGTSFPLLFTNGAPGRLVSPNELAGDLLPRIEIRHAETASGLYQRLRLMG